MNLAPGAVNALQAAVVLFFSPLLAGVAGKLKGWTESRRGPPVLQPYYDLRKYLAKETLLPEGSSRVFVLTPFIAFGAYLVISVVVPILTPYPLLYASMVDFLGGGLLFGLAGAVTLLAALDSGNNFSALGASRAASFAAFGEPTLIVVFFGVAVISGTDNPYVTNNVLASSLATYLSPTHLLIVAAFFLLLLAETGRLPVESSGLMELGFIDEGRGYAHSGRLLGILRWNGWLKQFLLLSVFVNVFALPWGMDGAPTVPSALFNLALLAGKLLLVLGVLALLEATLAKVRLFKVREFLALSFALAILSVFVFVAVGVA